MYATYQRTTVESPEEIKFREAKKMSAMSQGAIVIQSTGPAELHENQVDGICVG